LLEDLGVIVSIARMDNSKTQAMNFGAACTGMHLLSISVIWHISYMIVTKVLSQKHGMPLKIAISIGMFFLCDFEDVSTGRMMISEMSLSPRAKDPEDSIQYILVSSMVEPS
jgi:hypothetical protein